jgi:hypothetical protein
VDGAVTTHTPGPWEVHHQLEGANSVHVCVPDRTRPRGCRAIGEAEILGIPRQEAEANARLFAAAPDLLRSAGSAWHLCQSLLAVRDGASDELIRGVALALQAAIAKAEGR